MDRRLVVLAALAAATLPGCASRTGRTAAYAAGTLATFTGVVLTAGVMMRPTPCPMVAPGEEDPDPLCLGAITNDVGRVMPPMMLTSLGVGLLAGAVISSVIHRDDEPRQPRRIHREKLRSDRWYKLRDDPSRAPCPR